MLISHEGGHGRQVLKVCSEIVYSAAEAEAAMQIVDITESRRGGWRFLVLFEERFFLMYKRKSMKKENKEIKLECVDRKCRTHPMWLENTSGLDEWDRGYWEREHFKVIRISNRPPHNCAPVDPFSKKCVVP